MRISPTWECLEYIVTVVWYDSKEDTFEKVIEKRLYFGKGYMKLRVPFGPKIYTTERKKPERQEAMMLLRKKIIGYCI